MWHLAREAPSSIIRLAGQVSHRRFRLNSNVRRRHPMTVAIDTSACELCSPADVVLQNALAYVRYDNNSQSRGHILAIPKRHVASFFDMSKEEQVAVLDLL